MNTRYVPDISSDLPARLRADAADPDVAGLLVLGATEGLSDVPMLDSTVRDLSMPVFGGLFPGVLYGGEQYREGAVVVTLVSEPTVSVVTDLSDPDTDIRPQLRHNVAKPEATTVFGFVDCRANRIGDSVEQLFESYGVDSRGSTR